jgi:hypothetical protein
MILFDNYVQGVTVQEWNFIKYQLMDRINIYVLHHYLVSITMTQSSCICIIHL